MVTLAKGTREFLPIRVTDALGSITTLDGSGLAFDLYQDDEAETLVVANQSSQNSGMLALPLIDTVSLDLDEGPYKIWIVFTSFPEQPRLGPFYFRVDD